MRLVNRRAPGIPSQGANEHGKSLPVRSSSKRRKSSNRGNIVAVEAILRDGQVERLAFGWPAAHHDCSPSQGYATNMTILRSRQAGVDTDPTRDRGRKGTHAPCRAIAAEPLLSARVADHRRYWPRRTRHMCNTITQLKPSCYGHWPNRETLLHRLCSDLCSDTARVCSRTMLKP